jgi:hypothetical protein
MKKVLPVWQPNIWTRDTRMQLFWKEALTHGGTPASGEQSAGGNYPAMG